MVTARIWVALALTLATWCSYAGEVVVAFPLSMQPYFLPFRGSGLAYDTITAAFAAEGYSVRPLYISSRLTEKLMRNDSRADCVPGVALGPHPGWSASEHIHFSHDFAITRPGVRLNDLGELRGKRVLAYSGALQHLGKEFRSLVGDNPRYREIYNHRAQVRLLLSGSVDVIIADRLLVLWYLDHLRDEGAPSTEVVFHDLFEPIGHDFACRSPELAARFSTGLAKIQKDGTLEKILEKYTVPATNGNLRRP